MSTTTPLASVHNQHFLVVIAHGNRDAGILDALARVSKQSGCNILESKLTSIGDECSLIASLSGTWNTVAKLEAALPPIASQLGFTVELKRMLQTKTEPSMPYQIQVSAHDKPGIINELTTFFIQQGIQVEEMECQTYTTKNQTTMANLQFVVNIPAKIHLGNLRERFMNYCEDRNLDVILEPYKSL